MVGIARGATGVTMAEPTGPTLSGVGHFLVQGSSRAGLVYADARDPMQQGSATVKSGRAPTKADEVMLTQPLATRLNLQIGDSIHTGKGALTITGIAGSPYCLSCEQVVTLPQRHQDSNEQLVALPAGSEPQGGGGNAHPARLSRLQAQREKSDSAAAATRSARRWSSR